MALTPSRRSLFKGGLVAGAGALLPLTATTAAYADDASLDFIIDCDEWGARPPSSALVMRTGTTRKIVIHHMAFPNVTDYSREQAIALAHRCQDLHMDGNGWADTGQHFTISRGGYVLEGRHRSFEGLKSGLAQVQSAHCVGENTQSIGIENEGTYITETPPQALLDSLVKLSSAICTQYKIHAHNMFGHWDWNSTQCPGIAFYRLFPELRRRVAVAIGTPLSEVPDRTWPDIFTSSAGQTVVAAKYLLRNQGYTNLTTTGTFDAGLLAAIQDWQGKHGITVESDGTMSDPTWETLAAGIGKHDSGEHLAGAQFVLKNKGYTVDVTGVYDWNTKMAIKEMQVLHGLDDNGKIDVDTWCAIVGGIVKAEFATVLS
ncbi:N-acetylmuramoyl-L-alanine amidase [Hamadaea sp. NPDC050747]|uniref:peptidoglycan recognition protein family protein n=1 Tax=Hamadaea sp. NPDC050747 TaxID=3155789 RepID=UPI0033FA5088